MTKQTKLFLILLLILNAIVLLGQIWPEGAPPFARMVNILFLLVNFVFVLNYFKNQAK